MELRHLRYFVTVAEEQSFSKAAERLHIAQPPLSKQIKDLELELNIQLFDRSRRKIVLTSAGRDFLSDARSLLESAARIQSRAELRAGGNLGRLAIGVNTAVVNPEYFASLLRDFQRHRPGIAFSFEDYSSARQIEALLSHEIDVGFLRPSALVPDVIKMHRISREAMRIAVSEDHWLAKKQRVSWRQLANENFILVQREVARDFYDEFYQRCRHAGFEPKVRQFVNNAATLLWLVSAGLGIAPTPTTPETASGVTFVALPSDAPVYETALAWRQNDSLPVLKNFVDFVRSFRYSGRFDSNLEQPV